MLQVGGGYQNLDAMWEVLNGFGKNDLGIVILLRSGDVRYHGTAHVSNARTCSLADSSQISSFVGQCSQPALISLRAATMRPACSSTHAAAIHPGACLGFDLTRESNSIRARLMSLKAWKSIRVMNMRNKASPTLSQPLSLSARY